MNNIEKLELLIAFYQDITYYYEAKRYGNDTDDILSDIWDTAMELGVHIFARSVEDIIQDVAKLGED